MHAVSMELEHELEAAALELESELMRADGAGAERMDGIGQIRDAWRSLPPDVKQDIQRRAALMWELRGAYFARFIAAVNTLFFQSPTAIRQALDHNRDATIHDLALQAGQIARLPPRRSFSRPGFSDVQVREHQRRQTARGRVPGRDPRIGRYRELELELEMAADRLSNGQGEAESSNADTYRYWDVWTSSGGPWERQYSLGPMTETRENALRIQSTLRLQWQPFAQSRGAQLLVRCLSFSPIQNQWIECGNYSR